MDIKITPSKSLEVYARAVRLLSKCASWVRDATLSDDEKPWSIYYAVDTDVVTMYLLPDEMLSYGDVFGGEAQTAALLSRLLGEFLFRAEPAPTFNRQSKTHCLLLIPPYDEELYRLLLALGREVAAAVDVTARQFERLSQSVQRYKNDGDEVRLVKSLTDNVPELVMLYDANSGAKAGLDRFADLRDDKLINIETFHSNGFAFRVVNAGSNADNSYSLHEKKQRWQKLLNKHRRGSQPAYALLDDAEVLAKIELLNGELAEDKKRIVLITGSPYLFDAANDYVPSQANPDSSTFAFLYLRHPQWLMAHPDFFSPGSPFEKGPEKDKSDTAAGHKPTTKTAFNLIEWLGILFPDVVRDRVRNRVVIDYAALREHEVRTIEKEGVQGVHESAYAQLGGRTFSTIPGEWASQVGMAGVGKYAVALDRPRAEGAEKLAEVIKSLLDQNRWSFRKFREMIFDAATPSLSQMYFNAVWLGLWSSQGVVFEHRKALPRLRFDSGYKAVDPYCASVMELQKRSKQPTSAEVRSLLEANEELRKIDPSLYHSHIVHALAFATKGRWDAALTLCRIAMDIADKLPPADNEFRKGREAAYLAAIACRRSVARVEDLRRARFYLEEARKRENRGSEPDVRFKSEDLAIQTREIYFRHYVDGDDNVVRYAGRIMTQLADVRNEALAPKNEDVRKWVLRQCYTNFFNLLLVLVGLAKYEWDEHTLSLLGEYQNLLDEQIQVDDPHAKLVCGVVSIVIRAVPEAKKQDIVEKLLNDMETMKPIMPYDKKRTELFRRLIGEACA
jgi:hypothetical protein